MSKVIKAALWQNTPHVIDTPEVPKPELDDHSYSVAFDEEAYSKKMAEIKAKEEKAGKMLADAKAEAENIKKEAENDKSRILSEAVQEIQLQKETAIKEGHDEGYSAGKEEAMAQVREEMAAEIKKANAKAEHTLKTADRAAKDYVKQAEEDVVTIVMQVVEKILPQHFIDVPQIILPVVKNALQKVRDQQEVIIHVPPDYYEMVLMARDEYKAMLTGGNANITVHSDESLKVGDCLIETPNGNVDARLDTQLKLIEQAIKEVML